MRVKKYGATWYFSKGIFTEYTLALYKPLAQQLEIVDIKYLSKIVGYLKKSLDITKISLVWYKD